LVVQVKSSLQFPGQELPVIGADLGEPRFEVGTKEPGPVRDPRAFTGKEVFGAILKPEVSELGRQIGEVGLTRREVQTSSGNPQLDNRVRKWMNIIASEEFLHTDLELTDPSYTDLGNKGKAQRLNNLLNDLQSIAESYIVGGAEGPEMQVLMIEAQLKRTIGLREREAIQEETGLDILEENRKSLGVLQQTP